LSDVDEALKNISMSSGSPNYFSYMAGLMKDFFDKALSIGERLVVNQQQPPLQEEAQATLLYYR